MSFFLSKSGEEQEQLISEIISAGFTLHLLHDASVGVRFALPWASVEEGRQEHSSRDWVRLFTVIGDVTPVKHHRSVSRSFWKPVNLYKIMDMMPWGFCCCFFVVVFCVLSTEARQWGPQAVGTEMTSFSKDLPSALEFIWEAKCEEISTLLYSQPCCRLGIAPDHPPARHFCSSWALLSSPCLPKATQGQDTNITNSTKDPEGNKLPQSHPLQPLWLTSDSCVTRHSGICAMTPTQS